MDRHGRVHGPDSDARRRPPSGFRLSSAARFRRVVSDAVAVLPPHLATHLSQARLVIEDVPPGGQAVVLAVFDGTVLTVYRRPVEHRAEDRSSLESVLAAAIGRAVASELGLDGGDDPGD